MKEKRKSEENATVSIIITSYNYGHYLSDAIKSCINQRYRNVEILVIDDGSEDNTRNVATAFPVRYVFQPHRGVSAARNNGIRLSHGGFLICLDGDDKLAEEYVEATLKQMLKDSSTGFVYTGSRVWNEITLLENIWMPRRIFFKYSLFAGWHGSLGPVLVRREAFDSLDHGYDTRFPASEDLDICFRLLSNGWKSDVVYSPLHWYRVHSGSLNPSTPEKKRITGIFMDKQFWFRKPYRKAYFLFGNTLGRVEQLMRHRSQYLKGIQKKVRLNIQLNSCHWLTSLEREKASQIKREIYLTADVLVEWHKDQMLRTYYENRLRILYSRLENLVRASIIQLW